LSYSGQYHSRPFPKKPSYNQLAFSSNRKVLLDSSQENPRVRKESARDRIEFGNRRKSEDSIDRLYASALGRPEKAKLNRNREILPLTETQTTSQSKSHPVKNDPIIAQPNKELSINISWNPDASNSQYLSSTNHEANEVFKILNQRIAHSAELQEQIKSIPAAKKITLKLFANRKIADYIFETTQKKHDDLAQKLLHLKKNTNEEFARELYRDVYSMLDEQLGNEFYVDKAHAKLEKFLREQLSYNQTYYLENKEEQKAIRDWRVKRSLDFFSDQAFRLDPEWGGWGISASIALVWALTVGTFGINHRTKNILQSELEKSKAYQEFCKAHNKGFRLFFGLPVTILRKVLKKANPGIKFELSVAHSAVEQGLVEAPDVIIVNGILRAATTRGLTLSKAMGEALKNNWLSTSAAVLNASLVTSASRANDLLWTPESWQGKLGKGAAGIGAEYASLLSCAQPFFTTTWNLKQTISRKEAQRWLENFDQLNSPERAQLAACKNANDIKNFFERKIRKEILPHLPASRIAAASLPTSFCMALVPAIVNGGLEFIPDPTTKETAKLVVSTLTIPWNGAAEAFSSSLIGAIDKRHPNTVTNMAKLGQYGIDGVHWPFQKAARGGSYAWAWARRKKWNNPDQVYIDLYNRIQGEAAGTDAPRRSREQPRSAPEDFEPTEALRGREPTKAVSRPEPAKPRRNEKKSHGFKPPLWF